MTDEVTLLPCPWCDEIPTSDGTEGVPVDSVHGTAKWRVWCNNDECAAHPTIRTYEGRARAIEIWNRRSHLRTPRVEAGDGVTYRIEPSFPPNVDQFDIVDSNGVTIAWRLNTEQAQGVIDALSRRPSEAVDTTRPAPSRRLTEAEREVVEAGAAMYDRQAQALQSEGYEQASATVYRKAATLRALASENGAAVGAWQPIETAPKDGTYVLLGNSHGVWIGHYCPRSPGGLEFDNPWFSMMLNHHHMPKWSSAMPTRWQPLPAPVVLTIVKAAAHIQF